MPRKSSKFDLALEDQGILDACDTADEVNAFFSEMNETERRLKKTAETKEFLKKANAYPIFAALHRTKLNKLLKRADARARYKTNRALRDASLQDSRASSSSG